MPQLEENAAETAAALAQFAFDRSDVWMAVADSRRRIVAANPAWLAGFGVPKAQVLGRPLAEVLPPPALERTERAAGAPQPCPIFPISAASGEERWLEMQVKRCGRRILVSLVDVTARPATDPARDAAIHAREMLLHDAFITGSHYDPDTDTLDLSNEFQTGRGRHDQRIAADIIDSLVHPDDRQASLDLRRRLVREGGSASIELRTHRIGEDDWRYIRVLHTAGRRLASGLHEFFSLSHDVTELAHARDQARAKTAQLEMALQAAKAGSFEVDFLRQTVDFSPGFVEIVGSGFEFADAVGGGLVFQTPDAERFYEMRGQWTGGGNSVDLRVVTHGEERWIRFYCDVTRDAEGKASYAAGLVLDIDQAKRQELALHAAQEAAEAATRAKSKFLASMSHEIRTPMNGVVGVLHLLKREPVSAGGRKLLDEALACSGMLAQLIDDVLDFSKIEAGKLEIYPEATRVAGALEGVVALLQPLAEAKDLYLRAEVEPGLDTALVDPVRLRQCLFNLIGNAVKFTVRGGVAVRMGRPAAGRLRVEVTDTGIGVPAEAQSRLFERFEQADSIDARAAGGTGLGLAISRSLVELMDGEIGFSSIEGRGSTFWFEIDAPAADVAPDVAAPQAEASLEGLRVLVVDDNATNRLIGVKMLEALGAEGVAVDGGQQAIDAVGAERFDLVLMDVNMPGMDGLEATARIRALPGPAARLPIVALTANVMAHQRAAYLAAGMDGAIPKPFSPALLLQEILRVAQGGEAERLAS
ncbi:ATP-binding protein [Phenylobacterium sp.]|uniref:ATP-binding protein n=1 Tax=Phenylobacterium sp. TaxID=1871053 RepID=UPI002F3FCEF7